MRGPIDYIIVSFEGNKFNGSILQALGDAIEQGVISLVSLAVISKDTDGNITKLDMADTVDNNTVAFIAKYKPSDGKITNEDIDEVAELIENNTSAGLLIVEQLWAKPLKKAIIDSGGVLVGEGRIHPEAAEELNQEGA